MRSKARLSPPNKQPKVQGGEWGSSRLGYLCEVDGNLVPLVPSVTLYSLPWRCTLTEDRGHSAVRPPRRGQTLISPPGLSIFLLLRTTLGPRSSACFHRPSGSFLAFALNCTSGHLCQCSVGIRLQETSFTTCSSSGFRIMGTTKHCPLHN